MQGAIDKAEEILAEHPDYFMPQQFRNPANPKVHRETTAQEILHVIGDELDALVVGVGTGGTATGTGEILKQKMKKDAARRCGAGGFTRVVGRETRSAQNPRHRRRFYSPRVE